MPVVVFLLALGLEPPRLQMPAELRAAPPHLERVALDLQVRPPTLAALGPVVPRMTPSRPAPLAIISGLLAHGVGMADRTILRYLPSWSVPSASTLGHAANRYLARQVVKAAQSAARAPAVAMPSAIVWPRAPPYVTQRRRVLEWAAVGGGVALIATTTLLLLWDGFGASPAVATRPALTALSVGFGRGAGAVAFGLKW